MKKIILASASPRRSELLKRAGVEFEVRVSNRAENYNSRLPRDIVEELSHMKAEAVAEGITEDALVIGSDTVVVRDGEILGKPRDPEDAVRMLGSLQGRQHQVYTGVSLLVGEKGRWETCTFSECTEVVFYPVSEKEIRDYVSTGEPMDKAGAYGIQGGFYPYVKEIHGDYNTVVGLPVGRLFWEAKKLGINLRG